MAEIFPFSNGLVENRFNPLALSAEALDIWETLSALEICFDEGPGADLLGDIDPVAEFGVCGNCGSMDRAVDGQHSAVVCMACGCVFGDMPVISDRAPAGAGVADQLVDRAEAAGLDKTVPARKTPARYRRGVYLRERLAQWNMLEHPICPEDWADIEAAFKDHFPGAGIPSGSQLREAGGRACEGSRVLSKEEIGEILDAATARRRLSRTEANPFYQPDPDEREVNFRRKYLEKWLSIRWRFCGLAPASKQITHHLFEQILDALPRLEEAFNRTVKLTTKRKSFPHYSTVIHHILQLHGQEKLAEDLPLAKTRRARKAIEGYWFQMCGYLKWPYLTESEILKPRDRKRLRNEEDVEPPNRRQRL
jgi:hypothetical protein